MDIPGVRSKQELGGVRNRPGFGPAAQGQQKKRPLQWSTSGPWVRLDAVWLLCEGAEIFWGVLG